jgi:sodium/hydrogen antiporter
VMLGVAASDAGVLRGSHLPGLLARQIGYGAIFGALAGGVGGFLALRARRHLVDPTWVEIMPVASAALAFSSAAAVGGSGFIAAFAGGLVFGRFTQRATAEMSYLLDQLDALLAATTFVVFGAVLLEPALGGVTWAVLCYALLSLTVVRMVSVAIAMAGTRVRRPTIAFLGWFGPRGLASIVFAILVIEENGTLPNERVILTTVFITIGLSILLHGVTAAPLGARYARWAAAHPRTDALDASADG